VFSEGEGLKKEKLADFIWRGGRILSDSHIMPPSWGGRGKRTVWKNRGLIGKGKSKGGTPPPPQTSVEPVPPLKYSILEF